MTLIRSSHARPCRLCGASECACGGATTTPGIDPLNPEETPVSNHGEPVHEYDVTANGYDTVLNLTEKDAENYPGAKKRSGPLAPDRAAQERHREQEEKSGSGTKARTAPNK